MLGSRRQAPRQDRLPRGSQATPSPALFLSSHLPPSNILDFHSFLWTVFCVCHWNVGYMRAGVFVLFSIPSPVCGTVPATQ